MAPRPGAPDGIAGSSTAAGEGTRGKGTGGKPAAVAVRRPMVARVAPTSPRRVEPAAFGGLTFTAAKATNAGRGRHQAPSRQYEGADP